MPHFRLFELRVNFAMIPANPLSWPPRETIDSDGPFFHIEAEAAVSEPHLYRDFEGFLPPTTSPGEQTSYPNKSPSKKLFLMRRVNEWRRLRIKNAI